MIETHSLFYNLAIFEQKDTLFDNLRILIILLFKITTLYYFCKNMSNFAHKAIFEFEESLNLN